MTETELIARLQVVLRVTWLKTGKLTLNLRDGKLESWETNTYQRRKELDEGKPLSA